MYDLIFKKIYLLNVFEHFACTYVYVSCVRLALEVARRRHWVLGAGVTDGCGLPGGCWESSLGWMEEPPLVLLPAEPSPYCLGLAT